MAPPERPLLVAPPGELATFRHPPSMGGGAAGPKKPRQIERLTPQFAALTNAIEQRRAALQTDASGGTLEQVLVIETNGTIASLAETVKSARGLEWLAEEDLRDVAADEDFFIRDKPDHAVTAQLYLLLFNQQAINQLLSAWSAWSRSPGRVRLPAALRGWADVFRKLRAIRRWDVNDRLRETRLIEFWGDRVRAGYETVSIELELWFRSAEQRAAGERRIHGHVIGLGGQVTSTCLIEPIEYHAIVARLPIAAVERMLADPQVELLQCDEIRLVRPTGQAAPPPPGDGPAVAPAPFEEPIAAASRRDPVVAILDGLPLELHRDLDGRLIVDDPEDWSSTYPAERRIHATSIASLVLHGDLSSQGPAPTRPVYVRPILRPDTVTGTREHAPDGVSWLDVIHRAVRRIAGGDDGVGAAAPTVRIVNLSVGDPYQPFLHAMSPLAKLLDWLAWRYRLLFIVSAGNHATPIELSEAPSPPAVVAAVASQHRLRRLLSPAEAINALTVGATSDDAAGAWTPRAPGETDFGFAPGLPSPISAWGRGYRRAVKPEILAPGGRAVYRPATADGEPRRFEIVLRSRFPPGVLGAAPSATPGERTARRYSTGTSNAAALTSRLGATIADALEELAAGPNPAELRVVPDALWIRALLVHGACWTQDARRIAIEAWRAVGHPDPGTDEIAGVLGFGCISESRVVACTPERATILAGGSIRADQRVVHRLPLPASLNAYTGWRRLTITLTWFTPINVGHRKYRRATLWFDPPPRPNALSVTRSGVDWQAVKRGTVQHEVLEGDHSVINVAPDATLEIPVSCVEDAGAFTEPIPYALAVSLEVAAGANVRVYDEVRSRIRPRVPVHA